MDFREEKPQIRVGVRADRIVARARSFSSNVLLFSSEHFLRVLTARWLGLDASAGRYFVLDTASLSIFGYEHDQSEPAIRLWNDVRHVDDRFQTALAREIWKRRSERHSLEISSLGLAVR
jgi:probable phosphoglycerate mutase